MQFISFALQYVVLCQIIFALFCFRYKLYLLFRLVSHSRISLVYVTYVNIVILFLIIISNIIAKSSPAKGIIQRERERERKGGTSVRMTLPHSHYNGSRYREIALKALSKAHWSSVAHRTQVGGRHSKKVIMYPRSCTAIASPSEFTQHTYFSP